jgi:hypothetical protein
MFLESSRYHRIRKEEAEASDGRIVKVVALRRLPAVAGEPTPVKENDRLDIIAQRLYDDPTKFWHVADANTELRAGELVDEPGRVIDVPER